MPLTASDLSRLVAATQSTPVALVDWLGESEVDFFGESESLVLLTEGPRLAVLAHRGGACVFLGAGDRCEVYEARPACCRTFPLELSDDVGADGRRHLEILADARCPGTFDAEPDEEGPLARLEARAAEQAENVRIVRDWNRRQRLRSRTGRGLAGAVAFLRHSLERRAR